MLESSTVVPVAVVSARGDVGLAVAMAKHERLVRWVVWQTQRSGLPFEDAVHEGRIGLWRALRLYDPRRGTAFSTYAVPAIRRAVWKAVAEHRAETTAGPSPALARHARLVSEDPSLTVLAALDRGPVQAELRRLLGELPPRQAQIIEAHYGLSGQVPETFATIGARLGVSRQRVQRLHFAALVFLAQPLRSRALRRLSDQNQRADYQRTLVRQYWLARSARGIPAGQRGGRRGGQRDGQRGRK